MFEKLRDSLSGVIDRISLVELNIEQLRPILQDLKFTLIENDVAVSVAEHVSSEIERRIIGVKVKRLSDQRTIVKGILRDILYDILIVDDDDFFTVIEKKRKKQEPCVIVFVGINGTGKTTTIAKITRLIMKNEYSAVLACSDTYRAGAIEQLEGHAKRLGVRTIKHQYGSDAAAVAYDAVQYAKTRGVNTVLIDTAGRVQTDINLMREMEKIIRVVNPDLVLFVGDALTGNDAVEQALKFSQFVTIDASILTKIDADAKGGAAISISHVIKKPIMFLGTGQQYDDLEAFNPESLVNRILGHR